MACIVDGRHDTHMVNGLVMNGKEESPFSMTNGGFSAADMDLLKKDGLSAGEMMQKYNGEGITYQ